MSTKTSKPINIIECPLVGKILIESSAGTGKTFSLIILYLRLLLGLKNKKLLVKEILIVTFTEHSKQELYTRVKKYISTLKKICKKKHSTNKTFSKLISKITDFNQAVKILTEAENSIHEHAIYTIHGFCHKILQLYKFHSNSVIQNKIIKNTYSLYLQAIYKFWKYYFLFLPKNITCILLKYFNSPEMLLKNVIPLLNSSYKLKILAKTENKNIINYYYLLINKIQKFKKTWLTLQSNIYSSLQETNINKRIYNKKNLIRWINNITQWTLTETKNFYIPKELEYFRFKTLVKKIISGDLPSNKIFTITDQFLNTNFSLKKVFVINSSIEIKNIIEKQKNIQNYFEYNDLIESVYKMLKNHPNISTNILLKYPAALIDEFQDTNFEQYKIFKQIYKKKTSLLVLMSDPKQAIYGFQGADIYSYLQVKLDIKTHYHLNTNWRSSPNMIDSINLLFSKFSNMFLIKDINFISVKSNINNKKMKFQIEKKEEPSLRFLMNSNTEITKEEYKKWISCTTAQYILFWLSSGKKGKATITLLKKTYNINPKDITVIVRNSIEANLIQIELEKLNIPSIYISNKNSIFHSTESQEILWILKAILNPKNEYILKQALSTNILFNNIQEINNITKNYSSLEQILNEFNNYFAIWNQYGILHVIYKIILKYKISNNYNLSKQTDPNIVNILHIGELLEKKSFVITNKLLLVNWLEENISKYFDVSEEEYLRNNYYNNNFIKIVTIHKSKGLEYPITIIPFTETFAKQKINFYEKINYELSFVKNNEFKKNILTIEQYKLAEEIRLLYVALTRSILHCSVGVYPIQTKKINNLENNNSALTYILQPKKKINNTKELLNELFTLCKNKHIDVTSKIPDNSKIYSKTVIKKNISNKILINHKKTRTLNHYYGFTSYSKLKNNNNTSENIFIKNEYKNIEKSNNQYDINNQTFTSHTFPKGKLYGIILHEILKKLPFNQDIDIQFLLNKLKQHNLKQNWCKILKHWIYSIFNKTLNKSNLKLSKLNSTNYIKELKFLLPIKQQLTDNKLNNTLKLQQNYLLNSPHLNFNPIQGILTGIIDLIFCWEEKYFIIDYKSNWLGNNSSSYTKKKIHNEIIKNHYNFQSQLYSLALHRYLAHRIKNYDFKKHFGGTYILFIRAINTIKSNKGIFFIKPDLNILKKLEKFF